MSSAAELHQILSNLFVWHRYDPAVKAELFSTGMAAESGLWLIDPISIETAVLAETTRRSSIRGIIVTNGNHSRSAGELSAALHVPVFAHPDAQAELNLAAQTEVIEHRATAPDLDAIAIEGAPRGEIALYCRRDGGTLVVGDALINMEAYGFAFLPAKYCENPRVMRKSLRQLLDYEFERLLFAHGTPILSRARLRLGELLEGNA